MPVTSALALTALIYLRGWWRLRVIFPDLIHAWRLGTFMSGLVSLWIAAGSPLVALDHQLLTVHMVKHLLLMAAGPPLILWGTPALPLLSGLPKAFKVDRLLRSRSVKWFARCFGHPLFCWLAATATVIGWHLPAVFQMALEFHWCHNVEHGCFLLAGFLFWWPVVQPWPSVARWNRWSVPLYLFLATLPCDILSAFLVFCGRVVYPSYLTRAGSFHLSPLQDQEFAGALMWVCVTLIYLIPAAAITAQLLSPATQQEQAQNLERSTAAPALLSSKRAGI